MLSSGALATTMSAESSAFVRGNQLYSFQIAKPSMAAPAAAGITHFVSDQRPVIRPSLPASSTKPATATAGTMAAKNSTSMSRPSSHRPFPVAHGRLHRAHDHEGVAQVAALEIRKIRGREEIVRHPSSPHPARLMFEPGFGDEVVGLHQVAPAGRRDHPRLGRRGQPRP